jgi:hypothetical protein
MSFGQGEMTEGFRCGPDGPDVLRPAGVASRGICGLSVPPSRLHRDEKRLEGITSAFAPIWRNGPLVALRSVA